MRTVLVCSNVDCAERGSRSVYERLSALIDGGSVRDVEVREYLCFSACEKGPNVVVPEDRVWYCGVTPADAVDIVESHLERNEVIERLRPRRDSLTENLLFATLEAGLLPGEIY